MNAITTGTGLADRTASGYRRERGWDEPRQGGAGPSPEQAAEDRRRIVEQIYGKINLTAHGSGLSCLQSEDRAENKPASAADAPGQKEREKT